MLQVGLFGAGALALGGVGLSLQSSKLRTPKTRLVTFDVREFSILAAIADRVDLASGAFPSAAKLGVAEHVDALLATLNPGFGSDIKKLLALFENAPANLRLRPFTQLAPEAQDAQIEVWRTSRFALHRTGYKALRGLVAAAYFAKPELWPAVHYPGPPDVQAAPPYLSVDPSKALGAK